MFNSSVHQHWLYTINHSAAHKCINWPCYDSERRCQETRCLHWWNIASLNTDFVLILRLDAGLVLIENVQLKVFIKNKIGYFYLFIFCSLRCLILNSAIEGFYLGQDNISARCFQMFDFCFTRLLRLRTFMFFLQTSPWQCKTAKAQVWLYSVWINDP